MSNNEMLFVELRSLKENLKVTLGDSGVSRHGAQGARAPPLAPAKHNILYS